jgi:hypothetical protein
VRIAYVISAYKTPTQLVRLVDRLTTSSASFFVHVDRRTPDPVYREMREPLAERDVTFLARHACRWGDFGHVAATLKGLRASIDDGRAFDYTILLTGQDYPLRTADELATFFAERTPSSFLHYAPLPYRGFGEPWADGGWPRVRAWHFWPLGRHVPFPNRYLPLPLRRRFPHGLRPFVGSGYWCLHRDAVRYVLAFVERRPDFVRFYRRVHIPDESFFQTILVNSQLADSIVNDNLRYIEWPPRGPAILTSADLPKLWASGKLFARKFDLEVDPHVLNEIDAALDDPASRSPVVPRSGTSTMPIPPH